MVILPVLGNDCKALGFPRRTGQGAPDPLSLMGDTRGSVGPHSSDNIVSVLILS
jgi:hypothetical protein